MCIINLFFSFNCFHGITFSVIYTKLCSTSHFCYLCIAIVGNIIVLLFGFYIKENLARHFPCYSIIPLEISSDSKWVWGRCYSLELMDLHMASSGMILWLIRKCFSMRFTLSIRSITDFHLAASQTVHLKAFLSVRFLIYTVITIKKMIYSLYSTIPYVIIVHLSLDYYVLDIPFYSRTKQWENRIDLFLCVCNINLLFKW